MAPRSTSAAIMWSGRMPSWPSATASDTVAPSTLHPPLLYPIARLTERLKPRKSPLSRGHLSRPACSHVKQIAKRPGTRGPGGMISGRDFCWAKEAPHVRVRVSIQVSIQAVIQPLPPRDPSGPFRHAALAVRRDLRGAVPHPGLCLRELAHGRAALQERGAGLPVF